MLERIWKEAIMAYWRYCPAICLGTEENHEECVSVIAVPVEIRANHLLISSPELHSYKFLPGVVAFCNYYFCCRGNNETIFE
jgi:hypothetical protein